MAREIDRLRQEIERSERLARAKMRRIQKNTGVEFFGQRIPIRPKNKVKNYNTQQLRVYGRQLEEFRNRKTQFVADSHGKAIPRSLYQEYEKAFEARKSKIDRELDKFRDMKLDSKNVTISEYWKMTTPDRPHLSNPSVNPVHELKKKLPENISSEQALRKLIQNEKRQAKGDIVGRTRRQAMSVILKDNDGSGLFTRKQAEWLFDALDELNDTQFYALWNIRGFMDDLSLWYHQEQAQQKARYADGSRVAIPVESEEIKNIKKLINDVKKI